MAQYKETVNTKKALNLIAKMLAGEIEQIDFTKIKVSDKDYSLLSVEELQKLEELEEIKQETLVSEKVLLDDNTVNIHGIIYNTDLENSYYLRTIGLYANDPDEGEILYSVTPASHADYVPTPNGNNITTLIIDLKTVISGAIVNLQGNPSALVDVSMLNKKLDRGEGLEEEFDTGVKIVNELKKKQNKEDSSLLTTVKNIVGAINELFSNKLEKGGYTGNAKNLNDEISKKASKTVLGRMLVGDNLTVDDNGRVSGNPAYTHPAGAGNNHIPAGGSIGQVLKNSGNGVATWGDMDLGNYYTKTETDEKFKNFCPFKVGDIYLTTNSTNPSSIFLGTTWQKIEGRFLLGTSGSGVSKATGGSNSKTIAQANLPNVKLTVNSFSLSRGTMDITGAVKTTTDFGVVRGPGSCTGAFAKTGSYSNRPEGASGTGSTDFDFQASRSWTGSTNSVAPQTSALGSGSALDITPSYYTCHMWLRLT